jgi:hypothetical protein
MLAVNFKSQARWTFIFFRWGKNKAHSLNTSIRRYNGALLLKNVYNGKGSPVMMTLGAYELAIIVIAWLAVTIGPVIAMVAISMVRRWLGKDAPQKNPLKKQK